MMIRYMSFIELTIFKMLILSITAFITNILLLIHYSFIPLSL